MAHLGSAFLAFGVLAFTGAACSDPIDPDQLAAGEANPAFTTDKAAYVAVKAQPPLVRYTFQVVAQFTNTTDQPMYLARCYPNSPTPMFGIELLGNAVVGRSAYDPSWACVGHDEQFEVLPGVTRVDTIEIAGPNTFEAGTNKGFGALAGRMRLIYAAQSCRGDGACRLTGSIGLSTPFQVRTN